MRAVFVSIRADGLGLNCNVGCKIKRKAEFSIFTPNHGEDIPVPYKSSRLEFTACAKHLAPALKRISKRRGGPKRDPMKSDMMRLAGEIAKRDPSFAKRIGNHLAAALLQAEDAVEAKAR